MRILTTAGLCGLALVGLAGCGRNAASSSASAPASSAASAAAPSAPAPAAAPSMPHRRDGLWEQKMTMEGMNMVQTSQICILVLCPARASAKESRIAVLVAPSFAPMNPG